MRNVILICHEKERVQGIYYGNCMIQGRVFFFLRQIYMLDVATSRIYEYDVVRNQLIRNFSL